MNRILILILMFLTISCIEKEKEQKVSPSWAAQMQKTAKAFRELAPYLYSKEKFSNKSNTKVVEEKIQKYRDSIHEIKKTTAQKLLGKDPYVMKGIESLDDLVDRSYAFFKRGDRQNSRILLKATTNSCFKCHTRQDIGPKALSWKNFDLDKIVENPFERAQVLVAMRQYEPAKKELIEFLEEREADHEYGMSYEDALTYHLMISIRGNSDLKEALAFLQDRLNKAKLPTELKYTLRHWENDLSTLIKKNLKANIESVKTVLKRNQKSYSERNMVNNLVATKILHQMLMSSKTTATSRAHSYLYLGKTYDQLVTAGFWDLPELYFELCIDEVPHSGLAKNCFKQLKETITLGYSGSRGTFIPVKEYRRLELLRAKAK